MRTVRDSFALVGIFFVVAGILLIQYGQSHGIGAALPFGLIYAAAGVGLIAYGFVPRDLR